jgi:DNA polymerase
MTIPNDFSHLKPIMSSNLESLIEIAHRVMRCTDCGLCQTRTNAVPGGGSPDAKILFVGEAPGEDEDEQGVPFIGKAGNLLNEGLRNAGIGRDEIYITNALKCHPPGNRNPSDEETQACSKYLKEQIAVLKPELIVVLGKVAAEFLLGREVKITKENGKIDFLDDGTVVLMVLHPAYVLRNQAPEIKESFFNALKQAKELIS